MDSELAYEDTPSDDRKMVCETSAASWLDSCHLAQSRFEGKGAMNIEEDGLVLVSHVIEAKEPMTCWSLGFIITSNDQTQYVVSCSHTLESVRNIRLRPFMADIIFTEIYCRPPIRLAHLAPMPMLPPLS